MTRAYEHEERRISDRRITNGNGNGNGNGKDWRSSVLVAMWAVLFAMVGWVANNTTAEMNKMREQINASAREIAVVQVEFRNNREQLDRIETVVRELREEQINRRR